MAHINKCISLFKNVLRCNGRRFLSTRPPIVQASFFGNPIVIGLGLGVGSALGYAYYTNVSLEPVFNEMANTQPVLESFPEGIKVSRKVSTYFC